MRLRIPASAAQATSGSTALVAVETRRAASPTCPTACATAATVFGSPTHRDPASRAHAIAWRACSRISPTASRSRSSKETDRLAFDTFADVGPEVPGRGDVDVAAQHRLELSLEPREVEEREPGVGVGLDEYIEVRRRTKCRASARTKEPDASQMM